MDEDLELLIDGVPGCDIDDPDLICELMKTELSVDLLDEILSKSLDVNHKTLNGVTAAHVICGGDISDQRALELIDLINQYNADFDVVDLMGRTPLILAIETDKHETVDRLLELSVSVNKLPDSIISPLMLSIKKSLNDLAVKLIILGADYKEFSNGETPLSMAIDTRNEFLEGFLTAKGATRFTDDDSCESVNSSEIDETWF